MKRAAVFALTGLLIGCAGVPAHGESLAELQMHVLALNTRGETAIAVVDSIWDAETGASLTARGLSADCMLAGNADWAVRIRHGDTLVFKLVKQGGYRLLVPHAGWPLRCRCAGVTRTRTSLLQGGFVGAAGLDDALRLRGFFGPRKPPRFRLRVGWKSQELSGLPPRAARASAKRVVPRGRENA